MVTSEWLQVQVLTKPGGLPNSLSNKPCLEHHISISHKLHISLIFEQQFILNRCSTMTWVIHIQKPHHLHWPSNVYISLRKFSKLQYYILNFLKTFEQIQTSNALYFIKYRRLTLSAWNIFECIFLTILYVA